MHGDKSMQKCSLCGDILNWVLLLKDNWMFVSGMVFIKKIMICCPLWCTLRDIFNNTAKKLQSFFTSSNELWNPKAYKNFVKKVNKQTRIVRPVFLYCDCYGPAKSHITHISWINSSGWWKRGVNSLISYFISSLDIPSVVWYVFEVWRQIEYHSFWAENVLNKKKVKWDFLIICSFTFPPRHSPWCQHLGNRYNINY